MFNTVLIVNASPQYTRMFADKGWAVVTDVNQMDSVQLVCFTGGEDVTPSLYGERSLPTTYSNLYRDEYEREIYLLALSKDIPCVGICRGGQFLNVMNGGKMYQHVSRHTVDHEVVVHDDEFIPERNKVVVTSTHHQMMRPHESAKILVTAKEGGWKEYVDGNEVVHVTDDEQDIESVFYPHTRSLCFQPHPEFYGYDELKTLFFFLVNKYCL